MATTSAGYAFSVGRRDNAIGRDETMAYVTAIVAATDLPVSADLGTGLATRQRASRKPIKLAAEAGLVGGSVEDVSGRADGAHPSVSFHLDCACVSYRDITAMLEAATSGRQ